MITRDVRWLGKSYGEHFNLKTKKNLENTELESSDDEEFIAMKVGEEQIEEIEPP
jgi:hypothetical protein